MALAPPATARFGMLGFVAAYALAVIAWTFARHAPFRFATVVLIAILLRLAVAFDPPRLSGDVYRYLFDGRTLASGRNPYTVLPDDPRVNHPEIPTIYPPHAELLFAAVHNLAPWRLLLIACDIGILFGLARRWPGGAPPPWDARRVPASRRDAGAPLSYALFPPAIFEGAWSAHVEIVAALLLLVAWQRRSALAAACAVGIKVIPIAAVPALFARAPRRLRFAIVFVAALVLPAIPFMIKGPLMPGMRDYATRWVFNSPLYDAAFFIFVPFEKDLWSIGLYPDLLARSLLAVVALLLIAKWWRDPVASVGALLLCSPAIHPWYWLAVAPLALRRGPWLWLALCAPFSYLLYAGAPRWIVYALCYALPLVIARILPSATASSAAESPHAETPSRTARDTSPS